MPRSVALVVAWLLAAAASLAVAWQGVGVVGEQVTDDRPAPLTAEELGAPPPTSSPETTVPSSPASSTTTTTTASTTASTSTSTPDDAAAVQETYSLIGGSVTLAFTPSLVRVVLATPNPGFVFDEEPEHGNGVKVEFESETHRSRIDGWWDGGPQVDTREEPDGGSSGPG